MDHILIRDNMGRLQREPVLEYSPPRWAEIRTGTGGRTDKAPRVDGIKYPPEDPPPDQREDVNAYQRWRRRQQHRDRMDLEGGLSEHSILITL